MSFGLCWGIFDKTTSLQPPQLLPYLSIYVSIRVNEQWFSFEPESRAVISLSSNTPTGSNDAKTWLAMPAHKPFEEHEKKLNKKI